MKSLNKLIFCSLLVLFSHALQAEPKSMFHRGETTGTLSTNISELRSMLLSEQQSIIIALPLPNGKLVNFKLIPESIMADELASKYPNIRTFSGVSLDNSNQTGRFDITPNGFHGMFYHNGERVFIEPDSVYIQEEVKQQRQKAKRVFNELNIKYKSYFSQDSRLPNELSNKLSNKFPNRTTYKFHQPKQITQPLSLVAGSQKNKAAKISAVASTIKTYRIAISAAAEYTTFNGGTVDSTMAEIITLVNRLNQVYQHDLAIKLELVENNDLLIFTDANTDPFENSSDDGEINTDVIDGIIGSDNYDIGHVLNTEGGGLAVLGGVCDSLYKGDGVTGDSSPNNDAFYIDYVAHEVGHQFGADHSFNGTAGACLGNRAATSAYEVGSGSTIMGYAGICDDQDLQQHSDAFFHAGSIDEINDYIENGTGNTCGIATGATNSTANVDAGLDYIIPARTPFKLSGSAEDLDSINLKYSWQQFDLGDKSSSLEEMVDNGNRPLFRAFLPSSDTSRYFPKVSDVLNNTTSNGESLPSTNRELNFRLMVSDNEGGVSFDEVKLTVVDTAQAFALNSPVLNDAWTTNSNSINWQVADTNAIPINCSAVDVLLSKDDGENFDVSLASGIANNGNSNISIDPFCADEINSTQARIKLVCVDNIFFAINNGAFSINKEFTATEIAITGQQTLSLTQGESIELTSSQFTYACETPDSITIQSGDNYSFTGTTLTPNSDFSGLLSVGVVVNKNDISSEVFSVSISVEAKPEPTPEPTPEPPAAKSSGSITWLIIFMFILPWRILFLAKST